MVKLLKQLLEFHEKAIEESRQNDYFLHLALLGYLFSRRAIRQEAGEGVTPEIETLLENHVVNRIKIQEELGNSKQSESMIELFWTAIKMSADSNQIVSTLEDKIYSIYLRPSAEFCQELISKNIPQINSLPDISITEKLPLVKIQGYFELFAQRFIDQSDKVFYTVARDLVKSVLLAFADNSYFACQRLIGLQNIPLLPYLICDCIIEEILRLPTPAKRVIYFSSICVTMVKEFTAEGNNFEFGPAIGEAIQIIFGVENVGEAEAKENVPK